MEEIENALEKFRSVIARASTSAEDYANNLRWVIEDLEVELDAAEADVDNGR